MKKIKTISKEDKKSHKSKDSKEKEEPIIKEVDKFIEEPQIFKNEEFIIEV